MIVDCENFIFGIFTPNGYHYIPTTKVHQYLTEKSLSTLKRLSPDGKERETYTLLPQEKMVAFSYLKPKQDEYGRVGVWNHTILIYMTDLLELLQAIKLFRPHFIHDMNAIPSKPLPPIIVER